MIKTGKYDYYGKDYEYIEIDLSDKKHKNRVLDILEEPHPLNDEYRYSIKAQWTPDGYHPWMTMDETDLINLSKALNKLVEKIETNRQN